MPKHPTIKELYLPGDFAIWIIVYVELLIIYQFSELISVS